MSKRKNKLVETAIIFIAVLFLLTGFSCTLLKYKEAVKKIVIEDVDIKKVKDGVYEGFYDIYLVTARVNVTVRKGKITQIDILEHKHGKGYGADRLTNDIIASQGLKVDAVTGATGSSKTLLKAVEIALKKGV